MITREQAKKFEQNSLTPEQAEELKAELLYLGWCSVIVPVFGSGYSVMVTSPAADGVARHKDVERIMGLVDSLILSSQNAHSEIRKLEKRIEALETKPHRSSKGINPGSRQDLSVDAISKTFLGE